MKNKIKSTSLLFLTAIIWGFAFVAQKVGADYVGAFTFNGVRFLLGACSLIPVILIFEREEFNKKKFIKSEMISKGTVNASAVSVRKIVAAAINSNATGVVLAHNHPSGIALPSGADIVTTKRVHQALELILWATIMR